ncbi:MULTISPECIES: spore coat protein [Bacillus cereus group]|uniref:Spore coat protein n=1 Tax=Bacillus thuringiensis serovar vazensis TaxID=180867 RepID=A0A243D0N3_BACTU|nr:MULTISPECIES: spore coat protein [Bacillus cereus group]EEM90025.1 Coat F domain protein [Bacillus thuringiensis serovar pulsiensis BGSC 4CC1]MCU5689163.1 spore coat protein [Bacillus cereus]MEB9905961.1 spore coat protein [Bacillus anthracis]MEC1953629.1 spore coat protein [Bacillus anthracis]OTY78989.1 spore coat protein [Bacillus thuringiensis serovar vazensis]
MDCMKELMRYSYMLIYKVGEYTGEVRDGELKELLQHHLPYMLQAYNEQVNFQEGENVQHITCEPIAFHFHEMEKETDSKYTGDMYIATCYISHLKRLALKFAQVAVEVANPEFRSFLENCFLKMNRYAYSVWQYVVKKEYKIKNVYENEKFA